MTKTLEQETAERLKIEVAIWGNMLKNNGRLEEGDELVMRVCVTHFAQEWAIKAHDTSKEPSINTLLDKYK